MDDKKISASAIGNRIKSIRMSMNKTQDEFADFISCSTRTLKRYEAGDIDSIYTINCIAEKTGVNPKSILFGND